MIDPVCKIECMTAGEAKLAGEMFRQIGGFTGIEVAQIGGEFATAERGWMVRLWSVNAKAGNRNLTNVERAPANMADAKRIARAAKGKTTAADKAAFARATAEKECDAE